MLHEKSNKDHPFHFDYHYNGIALYKLSLLKDNFTSDDAAQKVRTQELIECFNNKDVHRLKSMFCKTTTVSPDIDKQIKNGIDFYSGKNYLAWLSIRRKQ